MPPANVLPDLASMRKTGAFADVTIACGGETFNVHKFVVCQRSPVLQEACSTSDKGTEVVVRDDTFDAATMSRMLDFLYEGDYNAVKTCTEDDLNSAQPAADSTVSKLDVLSHLFCHAIGEHYQITELSQLALEKFASTLEVIALNDFADLVGVISAHTEAETVHVTLQAVILGRLDELAQCESFLDVLGCKHLEKLPAEELSADVSARIRNMDVLAALGAIVFGAASQRRLKVALEKDELGEKCEQAMSQVEQLRRQVDKDMTTLRKGEETHNAALKTIQAAEERAKRAEDEAEEYRALAVLSDEKTKDTMEKLKKTIEKLGRRARIAEDKNSLADLQASVNEANKTAKDTAQREVMKLQQDLGLSRADVEALKEQIADLQKVRQDHDRLQSRNQKLENEAKDAKNLMSKLAKLEEQMDQLRHAPSRNVSTSSSAWDSANRRQYIIRRICHLVNKLDECDGCGSEFNVKLVWNENIASDGMENEVVLKCKDCLYVHQCFEYLH